MDNWEMICDYVLNSEDCKDVHKMAYPSVGWIYITERDGTRHKITTTWSIDSVKKLVESINNRIRFYEPDKLNQ